MGALRSLVRIGVVVLLGASAWYGVVAGARRWRPCAGSFDSDACVVAQTHETEYLPELARPEAASLLLLGGAVLLLAMLGRMAWGWRAVPPVVGSLLLLLGVWTLQSVGATPDPGPAPGGLLAGLGQALMSLAFLVAPLAMVAVAARLFTGPAAGAPPGWRSPDRPLGLAWAALALAWPTVEFFLLSAVYASHDAPPGTGLLRSAMVALAAVLVCWHTVARWVTGGDAQAASTTSSAAPSRSPASTNEA